MGFLKKLDHHADLMNRMGETLHANLDAALSHETLSAQELRNAILACVGCEGGDDCLDWLATHPNGAEDTPGYCRNREMLLRLRSQSDGA